jgi:hypothetical protein
MLPVSSPGAACGTARALEELRRQAPAVIVRRAGQVNIGQQQLNVAAARQ